MEKEIRDPVYATLEQLAAVENRVSLLEQRLAKIEGILEQMDKRISNLEHDFREFRGEVDKRLMELRHEINSNLKWTIGVMVSLWLSAVIPMLLKILGVL